MYQSQSTGGAFEYENAYQEVIEIRGKGLPADDEVTISGADPVFSTEFKTVKHVLRFSAVRHRRSDIWETKNGRR